MEPAPEPVSRFPLLPADLQSPVTRSGPPLGEDPPFLVAADRLPMAEEWYTATLRSAGRQLAQGLLQLVYPSTCFACGQLLPAGEQAHFCTDCRSDLTT